MDILAIQKACDDPNLDPDFIPGMIIDATKWVAHCEGWKAFDAALHGLEVIERLWDRVEALDDPVLDVVIQQMLDDLAVGTI